MTFLVYLQFNKLPCLARDYKFGCKVTKIPSNTQIPSSKKLTFQTTSNSNQDNTLNSNQDNTLNSNQDNTLNSNQNNQEQPEYFYKL